MSIKKAVLVVFLIVVLLVLAALIDGYNKQSAEAIDSFEECAEAGYPILESYPEQCITPDGRGFTRKLTPEERKKLEESFPKEEEKVSSPTPPLPPAGDANIDRIRGQCKPTGCSGQVCSDQEVFTTCEWKEEYACYADYGICERQPTGECGWRDTGELNQCVGEKDS